MAGNSSDVLGPSFYSGRVNTSDLVDTGYKIGDNTLDENQTVVEATRRSIVIPGIAADQEYTVEITAYRRVDPDVAPGGIVRAAPVVAPSSPYRGVEIVKLGEDVMVGVVKANEIKPLIDAAKTEGTNARAEAVQVRTDLVPTITAAKAEGTTARSEAAQVRTDLVPTITAAKAEGTAARNEAAQVRTDLVPTITAAKAEGTAARSEAATVASDLAGEVTRAKGAEGTLSTRITQAQGTADGAQTAITTEQTTRATADTALANRATILEAANRVAPSMSVDALSGLDQWTANRASTPENAPSLYLYGATIVSDADFGQAIEWAPTAGGNNIGPKNVIRVAPGRVYEVRTRLKIVSAPSDGSSQWNHWYQTFNGNLANNGGVNGSPQTVVTTVNNVIEIVGTISNDTTNAANAWPANTAYVRPMIRLNSTETGLVVRTATVTITDITKDLATNARITEEATVRAGADSAAAGRLNTLETSYSDPTTGNAALSTKITDEATTRSNADTALSNRATALESTLNTPTTGVVARLSTEETTRANADTALSNRATALESTINTPNTGLSARMTTEETTRANADTALSNRATALETTLNTPTTGVVARLTTEETTRANADTALSNRATALESTVNTPTTGLSARMTTEETTRANADTALANRATTLESKSGSNGAINTNPTYTSYTNASGVPDGWTYDNQTNGGASRVAGEYGGYAVQLASAANTACYSASTANASIGVNSYWVIEADVKLNSGTFAGAGVLWRVNNGSAQADATITFATDEDTTDTVVGAGTTGRVYRFRKLVQITLANVSSYSFYHMAHWAAFGSITAANSITFYRCAVRPASNAEIKALKADTALNTPTTGVVARLTTEETTRANADTALSNRATALESTINTPTTGLSARMSTEETTRANADTALSNRATALETTLNTPTTGVVARLTTEETTRANADTALSNRATALESTVNTPTTGLSARMSTEETTRANADTALSNRATALESTVNTPTTGLSARMTTEETTRASADTALSNRATMLEASGTTDWLIANGAFSAYPATTGLPTYWVMGSGTASTLTRVTSDTGSYAVTIPGGAGANVYIQQTNGVGSIAQGQWLVIEADVKLNSGTLQGSGVLFRQNNTSGGIVVDTLYGFTTTPDVGENVLGNGVVGNTYRFRRLVQIAQNTVSLTLFAMSHWSGFGPSIAVANSLTWYRCTVRPASSGEIMAQKADTALNTPTTGVIARLTTEETTRSNADTALSNRATALESTVNTPVTGLSARMTTEETTRANAVTALANRATALEARSIGAGNLLGNTDFATTDGWAISKGIGSNWNFITDGGGFWQPLGENVLRMQQVGRESADTDYMEVLSNPVPVVGGSWMQFYCYAASHRSRNWAAIFFYDINGNWAGYTGENFAPNTDNGGRDLAGWDQYGVKSFQLPSNVAQIRFSWRKYNTVAGQTESIAWMNRPYFGYARQGQTEWNPYAPGNSKPQLIKTNSLISDETTARTNADSALANRATALETSVDTPTTGLKARMSTEETTRANADTALSNRATSLEARSTGGGNLISNTDFISTQGGVIADGWSPVTSISPAPTFAINAGGDNYHPYGENALSIFQPGQAGVANYTGWQSPRFAVQAGTYLGTYCYMSSHRCQTQLVLYWTDAAGNTISASATGLEGGTGGEANGGVSLNGWRLQGLTSVQVPANAYGAFLELRKYNTNAGQADSYAWFVRPFAAPTRAGVTEFAPFSPGSAKATTGGTIARLSAEETARANAVSAVTSRTSTLESSVGRFGYLNRNPTFVEPGWDNQYSYPPMWGGWENDNTAYIGWSTSVASIYGAPHTLQIDRNGMNSGLLNVSYGQFPRGYYVLEADVRLEDGATLGSGIHVNFNNGYADQINFNDEQDKAETVGNRANGNYSFSKLIFNGADSAQFNLYMMAGWSGFNGNVHRGFLRTIWQKAGVRIATASEIAAGKVQGIGARVTTAEGTLATVNGKTQAYFSKSVSVPGAEAFITANAINDSGQATSNVAIGGNSIALYNTADGSARRAMYLAGGNATFDGFITARSGVRIGDGSWQIAVSPKDFNVSNGSNISYGYDLGRTPTITFGPCPVSLNAGEVYRAYAANSTSTGFTAVCEIVSAPTSSNQSVGPGSSSNGAQAYDVGKGTANATNNVYNFAVSGNVSAYAYNDGGGVNCVHIDAWLTDDLQAGDATVEDTIMVLTEDRETWEPARVERSYVAESHCVRITTASGIQLTLSEDTPITLRDGREIWVREVVGENVAVLDAGDFRWEEVVSLEEIGLQPVARLSVWSGTYAAGDVKGRMIFTHNLPNKP